MTSTRLTTKVVSVEITESARKRGFSDEDLIHAKLNAIRVHVMDGYLILVGPTRSGDLLEIGYRPEFDRIFHAMKARPKFL